MAKDRKLKGMGISLTDINLALYGKMDPDDCGPIDPDTWDKVYPKLNPDFKGKVIITSTPLGTRDYFYNLYRESQKDK